MQHFRQQKANRGEHPCSRLKERNPASLFIKSLKKRTDGGAHAGLFYPIATHFEAFIPTLRAINPISRTNWEGTGVQPDLAVAQEEAFEIAYQKAKAQVG